MNGLGPGILKSGRHIRDCPDCYGGVQLLQWKASVLGVKAVIQLKDYRGIDPESEEGKDFSDIFYSSRCCNNAIVVSIGITQ